MRRINYIWRLTATGFSFTVFGIGALFITITIFPVIHIFSFDRSRANRGCQFIVHLSFRLFIYLMKVMGILSHEIIGAKKLADSSGNLIIANHPTLIDVVFLLSLMPQSLCVVKKAAWSNPFLVGILQATGYIQNDEPVRLIADCLQSMEQNHNLLIFPEATRSVPGKDLVLKRGAASIIVQGEITFVPIIISCKPSALSKSQKWWQIPETKMHFKIVVGDRIDPQSCFVFGESPSKSNRRVNRLIKELFLKGLKEA